MNSIFEDMQIFKSLTKSSSFIEGAWSLTLVQNYILQDALQDGSILHLREKKTEQGNHEKTLFMAYPNNPTIYLYKK